MKVVFLKPNYFTKAPSIFILSINLQVRAANGGT